MSWTQERVELLVKMWGDGQSASQIAKELGGVTRNAVIGKVHRLGLSNRNGPGAQAAEGQAKPEKAPADESAAAKPAKKAAAAAKPVAEEAPAPQEPEPQEEPVMAEEEADGPEMRTQSAEPKPLPPGARRAIVPAGQPLPPQPSANEISPEALAKVNEVEKKARKLSLMDLTERTCKWPVGDPATEHFWFCGLPVQAGKPYCEAHVGVAFQPMSSRRDRKR